MNFLLLQAPHKQALLQKST